MNATGVNILPSTAGELSPEVSQKVSEIHSCYVGLDRARIRERYIDSVFGDCELKKTWKHAATNFDDLEGCESVKFLITVRHPASWLLALHKRPYHALQKVEKDFVKFIVQPWKTVKRDRLDEIITTPIELWNLKCKSYIDFFDGFSNGKNIFIVRFEDFSQSQKKSLSEFLTSLGIQGVEFKEVVKSSKGDEKDVAWYRNYYGNELWRNEISSEAWNLIKTRVDLRACSYFSYEM